MNVVSLFKAITFIKRKFDTPMIDFRDGYYTLVEILQEAFFERKNYFYLKIILKPSDRESQLF